MSTAAARKQTKSAKLPYVRRAERILCSYPSLKVGIENEEELEKRGLGNLFPPLTANYDGQPSGGGVSNPTEVFALKRAEKKLQVRQIERAIEALTYLEREVLEKKYFHPAQPSDVSVYMELKLGSTTYYKVKAQMLRKVAIGLNII